MFAIGAITLFVAFRTFGGTKAGKPAHFVLIGGLIVFLFLCCYLLYRLA
jgi:hypothetical protein